MKYDSRVTIIAVGICDYLHLKRLKGPEKDVEKIKELLVTDSFTALFQVNQFISLINCNSDKFRKTIVEYVSQRTANSDILIFYFSGHCAPIGSSDLGLCMVDTCNHDPSGMTIPLSLIRFSDIIETLAIGKIHPIIIIDGCYSGQAGKAIQNTLNSFIEIVKPKHGTAYALLCSTTDFDVAFDHP